MIDILAMDLEGVLVSNIYTLTPRPHLFEFIDFCIKNIHDVVLFSSIPLYSIRAALMRLEKDNLVPLGTSKFPIVEWSGEKKDLRFVKSMYPRVSLQKVFLLEDMEIFVPSTQKEQWIYIRSWTGSFLNDDVELLRVRDLIKKIIGGKNYRPEGAWEGYGIF